VQPGVLRLVGPFADQPYRLGGLGQKMQVASAQLAAQVPQRVRLNRSTCKEVLRALNV